MRIAFVAAAAAMLLAACGQSACSMPCAQIKPAPSTYVPATPDQGFDVLITEHDRVASVRVGQLIEVYLAQHDGMTRWSPLTASDPTVLRATTTDRIFPPDATVGAFVAARPGSADVTAYASPKCAPNQPCPAYAALFQVRVTVA